jgi:hypothetical protein
MADLSDTLASRVLTVASRPHTFGPGDPDDFKKSATPKSLDKAKRRAADKRRAKAKQKARK